MKKTPALKENHRIHRAQFGDKHQTWTTEWHSVCAACSLILLFTLFFLQIVWSDEKKFNLDGPDGLAYYWHDLRADPRYFSKRNFGGGSVMIWGAFSAFGKSSLVFVDGRINSVGYQNILEKTCCHILVNFKLQT